MDQALREHAGLPLRLGEAPERARAEVEGGVEAEDVRHLGAAQALEVTREVLGRVHPVGTLLAPLAEVAVDRAAPVGLEVTGEAVGRDVELVGRRVGLDVDPLDRPGALPAQGVRHEQAGHRGPTLAAVLAHDVAEDALTLSGHRRVDGVLQVGVGRQREHRGARLRAADDDLQRRIPALQLGGEIPERADRPEIDRRRHEGGPEVDDRLEEGLRISLAEIDDLHLDVVERGVGAQRRLELAHRVGERGEVAAGILPDRIDGHQCDSRHGEILPARLRSSQGGSGAPAAAK